MEESVGEFNMDATTGNRRMVTNGVFPESGDIWMEKEEVRTAEHLGNREKMAEHQEETEDVAIGSKGAERDQAVLLCLERERRNCCSRGLFP